MDAIIYAAGSARRMGSTCRDLPKILLKAGDRSLLEWHARQLSAVGVDNVHVVVGHRRDQVAEEVERIQERYSAKLHLIVNTRYVEGSVISMHASLPVIQAGPPEILLLDGDVLYDVDVMRRLIESKHPSAMLIDFNYRAIDDDPVLVPIRNGRPFELLKGWQGEADKVGESVGFFKVNAADFPLLIAETEARTEGARRNESFDEIVRALTKAGRFGFEDVSDLPWTEIDFPYDLDHAREVVLPAMR